MAEVLIDPRTGHCLSVKLDNEIGRDGELKRWGLLEEKFCGIVQVTDATVKNAKLSDLKVDLTKLTAEQKADIADQTKVAKFEAPLIQKSADEKAVEAEIKPKGGK